MNTLKELASIVTRYKVKSIQVIGNSRAKSTDQESNRYQNFYEAITTKQFTTEEEAAALFKLTPNDRAFKRLKNGLKKRLVNTLFFIDVNRSDFNGIQTAYYSAQKELCAINILLDRGANSIAVEMAQNLLKQISKFDFTFIQLELSKILSSYFTRVEKNQKKSIYYAELTRVLKFIYQAEEEATTAYELLITPHLNNSSTYTPTPLSPSDALQKLHIYKDKVSSHKFTLHYYLIAMMEKMMVSDYEGTILVCENALLEFSKKSSLYKESIAGVLFQKVTCLTQLQRLEEAKETILEIIKHQNKGASNWYKTLELYIVILMHQKDYVGANNILEKALTHKGFILLSSYDKEVWKTLEAWMQILCAFKKLELPNKKTKNFRLSKFINDLPSFSKDKRGKNSIILLLQLLFWLTQKQYDKIQDRIEAIEKYSSRYLKQKEQHRINCFIKMMTEMGKASFHKTKVIEKTKKWYKKMQSVPINIANQHEHIEIVPFEQLWEYVLEQLDYDFH